MKNILLTLLFILVGVFAQAQKGTTTFSISYGEGKGQRKPILAKVDPSGLSSEGPIKTFEVGASGMIGKYTSLDIGVSLLNHRYQYTQLDRPGRTPVDKSLNTFVFPIKLKVDILKYIFISGGILLNSDMGGYQVDLGFGIGAGVQYYYRNRFGIFIYPQTNIHSLAVGLSEEHVAFGLAYRIPNPNKK